MLAFVIGRGRSVQCAVNGIKFLVRTQRNAWVHAVATVGVVAVGVLLHLTRFEWCWMCAAMGVVWVTEAMNTAFELVCDVTCTEFHPVIEKAKDVAAGSVLLAAGTAVVIGVCILGPHLWALRGMRWI